MAVRAPLNPPPRTRGPHPLRRAIPLLAELAPLHVRSAYRGWQQRHLFADIDTYCMFVGYPRSGHSLVGALIDAHPQTLIAPELDALKYLQARFSERQLFALLVERAQKAARGELQAEGQRYSYDVPGQWQGRFETLRVIGDKKGGGSALRLGNHPALYDRLRRTIDRRLAFIHIVRNPFDNISTLSERRDLSLEASADRYFFMSDAVASLKRRVQASDWFEARHEDLIADPGAVLRAILGDVLRLPVDEALLESCASIVYGSPHRSRQDRTWPPGSIAAVQRRIERYDFLDGYTFDD